MKKDIVLQWLSASYQYYIIGDSKISDARFDAICKKIEKNWNKIESPYKHLIKKDCIKSGYYIAEEQYPMEAIQYDLL